MKAIQVNMFILHTRALLCGNLLCFGINKSGWTQNVYFYVYFFYFFFVFILLKTWFCCRIWILIVFFRELSKNINLHANVKQHLKSLCCFPINVSQGYNTVTWGYETMCQRKISPPEGCNMPHFLLQFQRLKQLLFIGTSLQILWGGWTKICLSVEGWFSGWGFLLWESGLEMQTGPPADTPGQWWYRAFCS